MKKLSLYAFVTFLISFWVTVWFGPHMVRVMRAQAVSAEVAISPSSQNVMLGDETTFDVTVSDATNVGAYEFDIVYDSAVVQVTGVVDGGWLDSSGRTVFPLDPTIDNTTGRVSVGAFSLGSQIGASGDGVLVTVTISTFSNNTSLLTIENLQLVDPDAQTIPVSSANGSVTVSTIDVSPAPSASVTPVPSSTPQATPAISPVPTATPTPSPTPLGTPVATPSPTPIATPALPTPVATPSPSPVPTTSPVTIPSLAVSPSPLPSVTPSAIPSASSSPLGSPVPSSTPVPTPVPSVTPSPSALAELTLVTEGPVVEGEEFVVTVALSTSQEIIGVDAIVLFDPRKLSAVSVSDSHLLPLTPGVDINNGNGRVRISQLMPPGETFAGSGNIAEITFKALTLGETHIGFDFIANSKVESNVIANTGADILGQPSSITVTAVEEGTLQLFLETYSENLSVGYAVSGVLTDTESTWSAQITTEILGDSNVVPVDASFIGKVKTLVFKVTGYLTKSFTKTITPGLNSVDLGKLKAGDLNDDGIINTIDLSLLYGEWFGDGGIADLNLDGFINSADYWVMTQNYLAVDE